MKESVSILDSPYYLNFLYYFNVKRDFFECHEHGEYLWLNSGSSDFLKGLIQLAVSLYHLTRGNTRGSAIMLSRGTNYLRQFPAIYEGICAALFVQEMNDFHHAWNAAGNRFVHSEIAARAPFIHIADEELANRLQHWRPVELPEE